MTVTEQIRERLLRNVPKRLPDLDTLRRTERSPEFEQLCMNRKILGAMRYGLLGASNKPQFDRVTCMVRRLEAYRTDGNAEHLVDVANLAEVEFVEGKHNGVIAQDDGAIHTQRKD